MEFKVSGSGAESKTDNTKKTPAPAATGTSEKDNKIGVITNYNDTTNCRACQVRATEEDER